MIELWEINQKFSSSAMSTRKTMESKEKATKHKTVKIIMVQPFKVVRAYKKNQA